MAQYGGEQYMKKEGQYKPTDEYGQNQPHSNTAGGHETGTNIHPTTAAGHGGIGNTTGTTMGTTGATTGHGYEEGKHGGTGGILHRTGSGSSSSSEDDGEGGRRKKKGVMGKIKEKLPGGEHGAVDDQCKTNPATATTIGGGTGVGHGYEGEQGHEKKGLMDKIKDKLPPGGNKC